ncbi:LysR family transcriptional regulator [Vibrio parahaemolyticus]|uniref:LysR family transcriptional regulator n=2 Tax=Vibrio parahaemolyticus TaxID=670 RepID=A0AAX0MBC7_VIBPH|nr:LysR family transcriptional regulator [Vibrio parahaemolyticus]OQT01376.1 LysR family transcriptional regulator [Vibrio parahaemolyticus O4:K12 str. K1203]QGG35638.1 LysR family transcriptional regulator [Vibrio parahaemolyticus 10329]ASZ49650.1 LysR family transcriptional regulator [Vibrio parahaemolyticus]AUT89146.1 LysR family transcriptional regulator [Vibrio parahaemolyticus]AVW96983.1 LysR family transcriptional regulator [Vibrio parahaemolyticus]
MSNVMDLNLIQTFLVVAEFQSYTKAAEQLGLTQPAVSAAIKRLEQVVDKQLFVKKGRGITLTSAAYQLLPQFEQAVSIIDNAITEKKHFEVYCSEILLHIMDPIKNTIFYESPPEKYILFELLRQQKADLVIDTVITKDAAFVMEEAYEEKAVIICREQHPRIQGSLSKEQFYDETHCLFSGKWNNMSGFEQLAQETILERKVELVTSSLAGMALYVAQRDCLGLVSQSFANKWSKALKLQVLPCPISIRTVPYKFVYHKRELNNPAHIALRERIKTHLTAVHYEPISL